MNLITKTVLNMKAQATPTKSIQDIFGAPTPPPGGPNFQNPVEGISRIITFGIQTFFVIGGLTVLFFLLWGAYDWITSGSEEEKLNSAKQKMTNAVIGIILMVVALGVFTVVSGDILGIIRLNNEGNWIFNLPTIGGR
jgi:hypothetical protein